MTTTYTTHFKFSVPDFITEPWHTALQTTFSEIDAAMFLAFVEGGATPWANSHAYTVGTIVYDTTDGTLWRCAVAHTSAATPTTFVTDRTAHPTYWTSIYATAISPVAGQFVDSIDASGTPHLSTPSFLELDDIVTGVSPAAFDGIITKQITVDQYGRLTAVNPASVLLTGTPPAADWLIASDATNTASWHKYIPVLVAPLTLYVRTGGSDSNTGLVDDNAHAFLTIQKAVDVLSSYNTNQLNHKIKVADGTYAASVTLKSFIGGGTITIEGNTTTPANVIISPAAASCFVASSTIGAWVIDGVKVVAAGSGTSGLLATGRPTNLTVNRINFGACNLNQVSMINGAAVTFIANYTISGAAAAHWGVASQGQIVAAGKTITISGTPAFSTAFATCSQVGLMVVSGNTFSGSATGARYSSITNAVIDTAGGGATYLPGDTGGSTGTGGQYV